MESDYAVKPRAESHSEGLSAKSTVSKKAV